MAYSAPNSFTQFQSLVAKGAWEPVRGNLYSVDIGFPRVLGAGALQPNEFKPSAEYYDAVNYFADSVTIPSRNITTGDTQNFGLQRSYATGQTPNELGMSFLVTKNQWHRNFFETWMNAIAPDGENRVCFYDDYICDIIVRKWERGSNFKVETTRKNIKYETRLNKATGIWRFTGAYPFNLGTMNFGNAAADVMRLDVQFKFERYRFTTKENRVNGWTTEKVINNIDNVLDSSDFRTYVGV
tara:strand:+ start:15506 stop:16228 length:723 start_codon:yes stop_codon:yes gene_type:complete